jgi:hypothetical protein
MLRKGKAAINDIYPGRSRQSTETGQEHGRSRIVLHIKKNSHLATSFTTHAEYIFFK